MWAISIGQTGGDLSGKNQDMNPNTKVNLQLN